MNGDGAVSAKLAQLSQEARQLDACAALCRNGTSRSIQQAQQALSQRGASIAQDLRAQAEGSRLPAMAELAQAQLRYRQRIDAILSAFPKNAADEALSLYAEYAADFALNALLDAQMAALAAVDPQREETTEKENAHE